MEGPRELGDILVELVRRCADIVGAAPPRQPVQARLAQRDAQGHTRPPTSCSTAPPLQCGWIATEDLRRDPASRLYFSDLARALREIDGVADISALRLVLLDAPDTDATHDEAGDSLQWQGADWALQLRWPEDADALARWEVSRRGSRLHLDTRALLVRLADARRGGARRPDGATRAAVRRSVAAAAHRALPAGWPTCRAGTAAPAVSEAHLARRRPTRHDEAQFGAYLALLEQWLAHGSARDPAPAGTVQRGTRAGRKLLVDAAGRHARPRPGRGAGRHAGGRAGGARPRGRRAPERRSRVLDLMLALHGDRATSTASSGLACTTIARAWQAHLLTCKRRFVQRIVRHTRDRAGRSTTVAHRSGGGAIPRRCRNAWGCCSASPRHTAGASRACWRTTGWPSTNVRRAPPSRPSPLPPGRRPRRGRPRAPRALVMYPPARARLVAHYEEDVAERQVHERLAFHFPQLAPQALPALFRCAVHAGRYHRVEGASGPELWLGPDEAGHWWPLPVRDGPGGVLAPALYLHEAGLPRAARGRKVFIWSNTSCCGRWGRVVTSRTCPRTSTPTGSAWCCQGGPRAARTELSLTSQRETIGLGCPAHIKPDVHWLDTAALAAFEQEFAAWLDARIAHARDGAAVAQARRLRRAAAAQAGRPGGRPADEAGACDRDADLARAGRRRPRGGAPIRPASARF